MVEEMREAGERAREWSKTAVSVLAELMSDVGQTGAVRVSAAKAVIDYAMKLSGGGGEEEALARFDRTMEELRNAEIWAGDGV